MSKYWIIVASREHVLGGVKGGFAQACHGKSGPVGRMKAGDWIVYYSSKMEFQKPACPPEPRRRREPCQKFVAIGTIADDNIYQVTMGPDFEPWRRDVTFYPCKEVDIKPLIAQLSFIKNKAKWGAPFRFGVVSIPKEDFIAIARGMVADTMVQKIA